MTHPTDFQHTQVPFPQTPVQRLSQVIHRTLKLRNYIDTIRRAAEQVAYETGQSYGFTQIADDCLPQLDEINDQLIDIHCSLVYRKGDVTRIPEHQAALDAWKARSPEHVRAAEALHQLKHSNIAPAHQRAAKYRPLIQEVSPFVAGAYIHCIATDMYFHLDIVATDERRLNRPPSELRYEPLTVQRFPSEVIEIRRHCIEQALANGQVHSEFYDYSDEHDWRFEYSAIPIPGAEEVLCLVKDAAGEQAGLWRELHGEVTPSG